MKKIIGYFNETGKKCYAKDGKGEVRLLHPGDAVYEGERAFSEACIPPHFPRSTTSTDTFEHVNTDAAFQSSFLNDIYLPQSGFLRIAGENEIDINADVLDEELKAPEPVSLPDILSTLPEAPAFPETPEVPEIPEVSLPPKKPVSPPQPPSIASNNAPSAEDDHVSINEDTTAEGNVLDNDSDPDGDSLRVTGFTIGTTDYDAGDTAILSGIGSLMLGSDGSYTFIPENDYSGPVPLVTYYVSDGNGGSDTAELNITITGTNDAPVLSVTNLSATEDGAAVSGNATFIDPDSTDTHTFSATQPSEGSVNIDPTTGAYTFDPGSDFQDLGAGDTRNVTFDMTVTDSQGASDTKSVTVTVTGVNDAPNAANDSAAVQEDGTTTASGNVLSNDSDVDNSDTINLSTAAGNYIGTYGTLQLNSDGSYTYSLANSSVAVQALAAGQVVQDTFNYTIQDSQGATDSTTLAVNVTGDNDAPVAHVDGDTAIGLNRHGTNGILSYDSRGGNPELLGGANTLDVSMTFTGNSGSNSLLSYASDDSSGNGGNEFLLFSNDSGTSLEIFVNGASKTVSLGSSIYDGNEHTLAVSWDNSVGNTVVSVDGTQVATTTVGQGHTLGGNGVLMFGQEQDSTGGNFQASQLFSGEYSDVSIAVNGTPTAHWTMDEIEGGLVKDSEGSFNLSVSGDVEVVQHAASLTTDEDMSLNIAVSYLLANDTDIDTNDVLGVASVQNVQHGTVSLSGGNIVFTPDVNYNGTAQFDYTVSDGNGGTDTQTVYVRVDPVNDAPVATDDTYVEQSTTSIAVNETGTDGVLMYDSRGVNPELLGGATSVDVSLTISAPATGSNSLFSYAAPANNNEFLLYTNNNGTSLGVYVNGTYHNFSLGNTIYDGNVHKVDVSWESSTGNAEVFIDGTSKGSSVIKQGHVIDTDGVLMLGQEQDSTGGNLDANQIFSGEYYDASLAVNGTQVAHWDMDDITGGVVTDDVGNFDLTVSGDVAVATHSNPLVTDEDTNLTIDSALLLGNDTDIDGDSLQVVSVGNAAHGAVSLDTNTGQITFSPDANYHGEATFEYSISDGNGGSDSAVVTVNVLPVNDPPVAGNDNGSVNEDDTLSVAAASGVLNNDMDVDGDALGVTAIRTGSELGSGTAGTVGSTLVGTYGTLTIQSNGSYTYSADQTAADALAQGQTATDTYTYTVSDGNGGSDTAELNINVTGVNDAPTIDSVTLRQPSRENMVFWDNMDDPNMTKPDLSQNGHDATLVSGTLYTIADDQNINLGTYDQKTIAASFTTGNVSAGDPFQVIYEQGGAWNGYSISVKGDHLYASVWGESYNTINPDYAIIDLGQISANTDYNVLMVHDGTAAGGGTLTAYLNGVQNPDVKTGVGQMGAHSGDVGIDGYKNDTIDPTQPTQDVSGDGGDFQGTVHEVASWNDASSTVVTDAIDYFNQIDDTTTDISAALSGTIALFDIDASDVDTGDTISYNLQNDFGGLFSIDSTTGVVSVDADALFQATTYTLAAVASDAHGATDTTTLNVDVKGAEAVHLNMNGNTNDIADSGTVVDNGQLHNGASVSNGDTLLLDGVDDYLDFANSADINNGTHEQRSVALWFKTSDSVGTQYVYAEGGGVRSLQIYTENGILKAKGYNDPASENNWDSANPTILDSSVNVADGQWHHATITTAGPSSDPQHGLDPNGFKLYLDGALTGSGTGGAIYGHDNAHIGSYYNGSQTFEGEIDGFRLYNTELTSSQVQELSSATVIDGIVSGLYYETEYGLSGYTDASGEMPLRKGDTVTFKVGDVVVGSVSADDISNGKVFLQDIAGTDHSNLDDAYVEAMAVFLQSLDSDGDPDNGITIDEEVVALFEDEDIDLSALQGDDVAALLEEQGITPVQSDEAMQHVEQMLDTYDTVSEEGEDTNEDVPASSDRTEVQAEKQNVDIEEEEPEKEAEDLVSEENHNNSQELSASSDGAEVQTEESMKVQEEESEDGSDDPGFEESESTVVNQETNAPANDRGEAEESEAEENDEPPALYDDAQSDMADDSTQSSAESDSVEPSDERGDDDVPQPVEAADISSTDDESLDDILPESSTTASDEAVASQSDGGTAVESTGIQDPTVQVTVDDQLPDVA